MNKPIFVAIEGVDCAGKGTLAKKVVNALKHTEALAGVPIHLVSFPAYELLSGQMVQKYLNGEYTDIDNVAKAGDGADVILQNHLKLQHNALFYASLYSVNRSEYFHLNGLDMNGIYVFDRYMFSNVTHQVAKIWNDRRQPWCVELMTAWIKDSVPADNPFTEEEIKTVLDSNLVEVIGDIINGLIGSEVEKGTPLAKTFYLKVDIDTVMSRLANRKNAKHEGVDIHENRAHLSVAVDFVEWLSNLEMKDAGATHPVFIDTKNENAVSVVYNYIMGQFDERMEK